ncbi:UNKNOWN [Stylonychia lemnae]|uniref:Trichohyalin-plectin-homology domain-containing protein n=1 Tax=Stylonychia lemnae TaxID=5949 RepID=A0A078ABA3_STYLE|nr:UNKNOWN [Stylonychia lemnae]|eukprot:CDW79439.1 UNKNOWN [Stylonychia lemnae]
MEVNDTLKLKAFGWKKDMITKQPHIQKVINNSQQYYPPDAHGVIDEWDALMKQQYDLMTKREQNQALMDKERKKQYHDYLDWQLKEKQRLKQFEDESKRKDLNDMSQNLHQMEDMQKSRRDENKNLKSLMANEWINDMAKNKQMREMQRQKDLENEKQRLEMERSMATDKEAQERAKKNQWLKEQEAMIQFKDYMKDKEKEKMMKDHEDFLRQQAEREKKKDDQDQRWNKFYKDFDEKLTGKQKEYEQKFVQPLKEKEAREQERVMRELEMAEKAKWDRETMDQMHRKDVKKQIYDGNLERLGLKNMMLEKNKEKDRMFLDQKLREAEAAKQRDIVEQEQHKMQKDVYKNTLMQQMNLKQQATKNYGKMTFQEKRLNRLDLDHYKNFENSVNALIPGINHINSVASRPLAKGAMNQLYYGGTPLEKQKGHIWMQPSASQQQLPTINNMQGGLGMSQANQMNSQNQSYMIGSPQNYNQNQQNQPHFFGGVPGSTNQIQSSQVVNRSQSQAQLLSRNQFETIRQSSQTPSLQQFQNNRPQVHNPILQPVDSGMQNPYIKRELMSSMIVGNAGRGSSSDMFGNQQMMMGPQGFMQPQHQQRNSMDRAMINNNSNNRTFQ